MVGTELYGRVKPVCATPVVTLFVMFCGMPLFPLRSYYFTGHGPVETTGIPVVAQSTTRQFGGIPIAYFDLTSLLITYTRALGGLALMALIAGCLIRCIAWVQQGYPPTAAGIGAGLLLTLLIAAALVSYVVPDTPQRERRIRKYCGYLLGPGIDPARVDKETAQMIHDSVAAIADDYDLANPATSLAAQLAVARAQIALGAKRSELEKQTSQLLDRLYAAYSANE